ncbi:hypothetical protein RB598_003444 [Gaeumannomyces tritici]
MSSRAPSVGEDSIPLYCALCPERRNFSDLSHLLTHISSKSHLSRKFDTELRAQGDDGVSAASLADYERWYAKHRIGEHLQRRMETKQRRRQPRRERPAAALRVRTAGDLPSRSAGRSVSVKAEPREDSEDVFGAHVNHGRQATGRYDSPLTRNGNTITTTPGFQTPTSGRVDSDLSLNYADIGKFEDEGSELDASSFDGRMSWENFDLEDDDTVKLKGIVYPGMAGFDAATPEQRRKRNQKKPKSVVQNMRITSESIEPVECIWKDMFTIERSRDIYASPTPEGSPVSKKAELPAKRKKKQAKNGSPTANRARPGVTTRGAARAQRQAAVRRGTTTTAAADQAVEESDNGNDDSSWTTGHGSQEGGDMLRADDRPIPNRMNSPLDHGRHQLQPREALQLMNSNGIIGSHDHLALPKSQQYHHAQYFGHHSQVGDTGMMSHHNGLTYIVPADATINPLNLGAGAPTYPGLLSAATSAYGSPIIAPLNGFQSINPSTNPRHGLHGRSQPHLTDTNSHMPRTA